MTLKMTEEPDEAEVVRGRPNAYFAEQRGMGGNFRGVPIPRPGPQAVHADDTIGSYETCWCGEPEGHDWPGKASGARHPRKVEKVSAVEAEAPHISRRDLRAYHEDLVTGILHCVNGYGLRYRELRNSILLYPKDGTEPFQIHARNNTRQVKNFQTWFVRHVAMENATQALIVDRERVVDDFDAKVKTANAVEERDLRELAEVLNGPEHPVPTPTDVAKKADVSRETSQIQSTEWVPYINTEGNPTLFETDGERFRCTKCDWVGERAALGGHTNTHQKEKMRAALYGNEEVQARRSDSLRYTALRKKVIKTIEALADAADLQIQTDNKSEVEALHKQIDALEARVRKAESERDDAKARLSLIQEAMRI